MQPNLKLKAAFLEIVDNQLRENDPPETRETYDRLLTVGYSDQEARELVGAVISAEIYQMLKQQKPFEEARFTKALRQLPKMPWE